MTQPHSRFGIPMNAQEYAREWERSANAFSSAGHYAWMDQQLGPAECVLEIGCGSGASTAALLASGRKVIAIDSNAHAIEAAAARLRAAAVTVEVLAAGDLPQALPWTGAQVLLCQADVLAEAFTDALPGASLDAIACWMVGTYPDHIAEHFGVPTAELEGTEMARYRELLHRRAHVLGLRALRPDGVVHLADRAALRSWSDKDLMRGDLAFRHGLLAAPGYRTGKEHCLLRKLTEGLSPSHMQYAAAMPRGSTAVPVLTSTRAWRIASP